MKHFLENTTYNIRSEIARDKLDELVKSRAVKRNRSEWQASAVSRRTKCRIETEIGIKSAHAEVTTDARAAAISDLRNAISFAAMNSLMVPITPSKLILNADASQFKVGYDSNKKIEVKYLVKPAGKPLKVLPEKNDAGITAYFIKYYLLMSAGGFSADPVFVIADGSMGANEIDWYKVQGLGVGTDLTAAGYVVFCQSRCCNLEFYKWFNNSILIPFVFKIKSTYKIDDTAPTWFQLDGEQTQIECYNTTSLLSSLHEHNIVVGKPPGSTTSTTQPCDAGNCFKGPKTTNKRISDKDVEHNTDMMTSLTEVFNIHITKYGANNSNSMSIQHKKMGVVGLLRVQLALQMSLRPDMIMDSFKITGIYPLSLPQIFNNCTTKMTVADQASVVASMPLLVHQIKRVGEISDKAFDELLPTVATNFPRKDDLVLNRRRSVLLTNLKLIEKEDNKRRIVELEREVAKVKKESKKLIAEQKKVAKQAKETAKSIKKVKFVLSRSSNT
jgi:hypothetical protein